MEKWQGPPHPKCWDDKHPVSFSHPPPSLTCFPFPEKSATGWHWPSQGEWDISLECVPAGHMSTRQTLGLGPAGGGVGGGQAALMGKAWLRAKLPEM